MKRANAKGSASVRVLSVPAVNGNDDGQHTIDYDYNPVTNEAEAMAVNHAYLSEFRRVKDYLAAITTSVPEEQKTLWSLLDVLNCVMIIEDYKAWAAGVTEDLIEQARARLISAEETDLMLAEDSEFDALEERFRRIDESRLAKIRCVKEFRGSPSHGRNKKTRIQSLYKVVDAMSSNKGLFLSSHRTHNAIRYLRSVLPQYPQEHFEPKNSYVSKTAEKLSQNPQALENLVHFVSLFENHSSLEALIRSAASKKAGQAVNGASEEARQWELPVRKASVRARPYHP